MRDKIEYFESDDLPSQLLKGRFEVTATIFVYNHRQYVERCLNSVLAQNFGYPFCILIIDDCSTDGTSDLIHGLLTKARIPDNFRVFYIRHVTNQFQRGRVGYFREVFNSINTNFFATLDGDDAWNDTEKIRKQHSFLNSKEGEGFSVCGHDSVVCDDKGNVVSQNKLPENYRRDFDSESLKRCTCWCLTNTLVWRGDVKFPSELGPAPNGDNVLWSTLGFRGGFKFLGDVGKSIYTTHAGGVWSLKSTDEKIMMQASTFLSLALHYYRINDVGLAEHFLSASLGQLDKFRPQP